MSHFAVAVFTDGTKTVEELLAPYQENNMEDCPKEYLEFHSTSEEERKSWETEKTKKVILKDGSMVWPWDNVCYRQITEKEYKAFEKDKTKLTKYECGKYYVKDLERIGAEEVSVAYKDLYPTFKDYMENYIHATFDKEQQDYGYWENPNAKWDWYTIGGRWRGLLRATTGDVGEATFFNHRKLAPGRYSMAKVKDIDFTPDKAAYEKAMRYWEVVVEGSPLREGEDEKDFWSFRKKEWYLEHYKTKEEYAERETAFSTYAVVLPDGTWHEKGQMGWWGCSSETHEEAYDWDKHYKENFIDKADPEWTLVIVDCHI